MTAAGAPKLFIYVWDRDGVFRVFPLSFDGRIFFVWKPVGLGMIHGSLSNDFHDHDVHADIRYPAGANLVRHFFFIGGPLDSTPKFSRPYFDRHR